MTSRGQCPRGGGACECLHPTPPSGNPVSAPDIRGSYHYHHTCKTERNTMVYGVMVLLGVYASATAMVISRR